MWADNMLRDKHYSVRSITPTRRAGDAPEARPAVSTATGGGWRRRVELERMAAARSAAAGKIRVGESSRIRLFIAQATSTLARENATLRRSTRSRARAALPAARARPVAGD